METPAVSLLIAVYNTETYLERCLDSLLNQSLANIEIIAVNDGSTDQSPDILETYQKRDERIRVIHQQNRGLGAVRNKGIEAARGEFIAFIDADDWVEPDYCLHMYEKAKAHQADLVICEYAAEFADTGKTAVSTIASAYEGRPKQLYLKDLFEGRVSGFSWNKLYKRTMIEQHRLRFPLRDELEHVEDQYFSLRAHVFAGAVSYVDQPLYHYRIHLTSIVQSYQKKLFDSGLVLYRLNEAFLRENGCLQEYRQELDYFIVQHGTVCLLNEWKRNNGGRFSEKWRNISRICADPVFRLSLSKTGTAPFDAKRSCLLLLARLKLIPFVSLASAAYQRAIEYKMKIRG